MNQPPPTGSGSVVESRDRCRDCEHPERFPARLLGWRYCLPRGGRTVGDGVDTSAWPDHEDEPTIREQIRPRGGAERTIISGPGRLDGRHITLRGLMLGWSTVSPNTPTAAGGHCSRLPFLRGGPTEPEFVGETYQFYKITLA